ncbi:MAG: NADPH-dependent F420 reductase [Phototrophicaceae bacterium]
MKIGIIGIGNIGGSLGRIYANAGHEVFFSYSRSEDKLKAFAEEVGHGARWGTPSEAVAFGDVILLAPPYRVLDEALKEAGSMAGKIVIDAVNPYAADGIRYVDAGTAAEEIAAKLVGAKTVKAYNHIYYKNILSAADADPRFVAFISGDDAEAKAIVAELVTQTGFDVWDLGGLSTARWTEPHGALFSNPMTRAQAEPVVAQLPTLG